MEDPAMEPMMMAEEKPMMEEMDKKSAGSKKSGS